MQKIDGKACASEKLLALKERIETLSAAPSLAVVLVGDDAPSHLYVKLKQKAAKEIGIDFHTYVFDANASQKDIIASIAFLNHDDDVDGIIVQLPLPDHLDTDAIVNSVAVAKDVDGFHRTNQERFLRDDSAVYPVFVHAIMSLIERATDEYAGKKAVVVGNSTVFGRMMTHALTTKGCHAEFLQCMDKKLSSAQKATIATADIIVTACGVPRLLSCADIADGAVVIDGGISRVDGKTVGDVDTRDCAKKAIAVSPVPGGVGPMTIACLLENVYNAKVQSE